MKKKVKKKLFYNLKEKKNFFKNLETLFFDLQDLKDLECT